MNIRHMYPLRPLHTLGSELALAAMGRRSPEEVITNTLSSAMASWNPLADAQPENMLMPTVMDPFVDMALNRNFMGNPIVPDDTYGARTGVPRSSQYFERSNTVAAVEIAQYLNRISGGDQYSPGRVDLYPGHLDYVYRFITGGVGVFMQQVAGVALDAAAGAETEPNQRPVLRSFTTTTRPAAENGLYYAERDEVDALDGRMREAWRNLQSAPDDPLARDTFVALAGELNVSVNPDGTLNARNSLRQFFTEADSQIRELRTELTGAMNGDLPRAERADRVRDIQRQIEVIQRQAREEYVRQRALNTTAWGEAAPENRITSRPVTAEEFAAQSDFAIARRGILDLSGELRQAAREAREAPANQEAVRRRDELAARLGVTVRPNGTLQWSGSVERTRTDAQRRIAAIESEIEALRAAPGPVDDARREQARALRDEAADLRAIVIEAGRGVGR